jgi:DNA-directed RNA polymerase subunit RPC12/RpoP
VRYRARSNVFAQPISCVRSTSGSKGVLNRLIAMKLAEAPCVSQREGPPDILDACGCLRTACDQLKAGSTVNHMRKSSSIPRPQLPSIELPRCPKCGEEMWLARVQAIEPDYNSNIFECPSCSERVITFGEYAKSTG